MDIKVAAGEDIRGIARVQAKGYWPIITAIADSIDPIERDDLIARLRSNTDFEVPKSTPHEEYVKLGLAMILAQTELLDFYYDGPEEDQISREALNGTRSRTTYHINVPKIKEYAEVAGAISEQVNDIVAKLELKV